MEISNELKKTLNETRSHLSGYQRRHFMAQIVESVYEGNVRCTARELGWNRKTLSKAMAELCGKFCYLDHYGQRGRKKAEEHLPNLKQDIKAIVESQSQTDPTFRTQRLYTRLSAAEVRRQLIKQKGYQEAELPTRMTLSSKLNEMGYHLRPVQKSRPAKKPPETDAIFQQLETVLSAAQQDEQVLRLSMDAKATVLIGDFSRGGRNRILVKAADHDFQPKATVTPYCIFLPDHQQVYLYFTQGRVTSDFIADCLLDCWQHLQPDFPHIQTLLLQQDNGPENHSRRTQFMQRLVQLADQFQLTIQLAYYPPYHSKYNPVERFWGHLEQHWNGTLLDSLDTVCQGQ